MGIAERKRRKSHKVILLLLLFSLCVAGFSGFKLQEISRTYREGDTNYEQLQEQVRKQVPEHTGGNTVNPAYGSAAESPDAELPALVDIPSLSIDFQTLDRINADSGAWLYCPDTVIDYPVMRANDYDWYLRHLPDGTYNANGSLFLDYNCPADFSGRLSIIYGHNMKSGKMFGSLTRYKEQSYFDRHPYMYLYTEQENYRIDLVYGCVVGADVWRERAFMYEVNLEALLTYASPKTTFQSSAEYTDEDGFVVLSTCSYEFDDARYIVIGVLRPEYGA